MYCIMSTSVYSSIILMINTNITDFEKSIYFLNMVEKYKFCILNKVKRDKELKNEKNNFSN